jgi:phenylacetaldehyde dehydrogenase
MREPIGVVAQIIPWNFPLLMAAWKLAPALACGCTIVLKLAEQTPLSGLRLAQLIDEAGFPPGVVNMLTGYGEGAGAPLAAHDLVDKVAFTGSTEVGKLIVKAAAGNLKKVTLELGGKSPSLIFPDAPIDQAISGASSAIFFNHGQCCCAGSRLYVTRKSSTRSSKASAKSRRISSSRPASIPPARWVRWSATSSTASRGLHRIRHREGAQNRRRRSCLRRRARLLRPAHRPHQHQPAHEGRAGGDLRPGGLRRSLQRRRCGRIVKRANDTSLRPGRLGVDPEHEPGPQGGSRLRAGTVWVNCHNVFDASLPFGGYKQSGWGREMGEEVLAQLHRESRRLRSLWRLFESPPPAASWSFT